jgi:hypothetical protein
MSRQGLFAGSVPSHAQRPPHRTGVRLRHTAHIPNSTPSVDQVVIRTAARLTPVTPYRRAVRSFEVPAKQSNRVVIATSPNPADVNTPMSSASSRAPAIQPVQRSMSRKALSGRISPMTMSAICTRPPGLSTRAISATARSFSGTRFRTPLEMTTSTL